MILKTTQERRTITPNSGKVWTRQEDLDLLAFFDARWTLSDLAEHFKRSKAAMVSRLVKYNRLTLIGATYCRVEVLPWCTFLDIDEKEHHEKEHHHA
jgi:hypothetical protein